MSTLFHHPKPDIAGGVQYWRGVPATVDGVLGGYGNGTLPRVDALGSRSFLLRVLPRLSTVDGPARSTCSAAAAASEEAGSSRRRTRALDVGAGVGRVSRDVLSHVADEVVLVEPAENLLEEAVRSCPSWPAFKKGSTPAKSASFVLSTLQSFELQAPVDFAPPIWSDGRSGGEESGSSMQFDVIWCQWMLQHLSDPDLIKFLRSARDALVPADGAAAADAPQEKSVLSGAGCIFIKENVCSENEDGSENVWWDEEDKSITRSKQAYERVFREAGLRVVRSEVQLGLPAELFAVHMWALV